MGQCAFGHSELSDGLANVGVGRGGELLEECGDVGVWSVSGWAQPLDLALGLELEVGELHLDVVDSLACGVALDGQVVDPGVELMELREQLTELCIGRLDP